MNVRFAEPCRVNALAFEGFEHNVHVRAMEKVDCLQCSQDIFIGVFFDGTNNNKFRDTPGHSHSNVARLYEAFPGAAARQTAPSLKPKVLANGGTQPRPVFDDKDFKDPAVPAQQLGYYRKIYIPGVGTPCPDLGDSGVGLADKTLGLSMARHGQARLAWALLQLCNQVHAAVLQAPIEPVVNLSRMVRPISQGSAQQWLQALPDAIREEARSTVNAVEQFDHLAFEHKLQTYERVLKQALTSRQQQPVLRKIRLSIFGFSRGAAKARAWANMVERRWAAAGLAGLTIQIDFLGVFDTVASVGLAQSAPGATGHSAWADDGNLIVPSSVKRCVHLVSAHEVRGSFPLDSVCQGQNLPANCKEVVYPGVHSDVGGGYPPGDQGRSLPGGATGDAHKLSQIPLAQMYREARMGGVPLAPPSSMDAPRIRNFAISSELRHAFNEYVAATRIGYVAPTQGRGDPQFARMFPTETQPREVLQHIIGRHAGHLMRWRRHLLSLPGGAAGLAGLAASTSDARHQDVADIRGAEGELRKELTFLQSTDPKKFDDFDDKGIQLMLTGAQLTGLLPWTRLAAIPGSLWLRDRIRSAMREKQRQWDSWIKAEWYHTDRRSPSQREAIHHLYEHYVHDSRAWFKPLMRSDVNRLAPDDEEWFVYGGHRRERLERLKDIEAELAGFTLPGRKDVLIQELAALERPGAPLIYGGREPYRMWGYLRARGIYQTGQLTDANFEKRQQTIEQEEDARNTAARRERMIKAEQDHYDTQMTKLREDNLRVENNPQMTVQQKAAYREAAQAKAARLRRELEQNITELSR